MAQSSGRGWKVIRDLLLAMVNATLILVAICLFLAWRVSAAVGDVTERFAENLELATPLADEVQAMTQELKDLRSDLDKLSQSGSDLSSELAGSIEARLSEIERRTETMRTSFNKVISEPEVLVDAAVDSFAENVKEGISDVYECQPPPDA